MAINVDWSAFKQFVDVRKVSVQYVESSQAYTLYALDGAFAITCKLTKESPAPQGSEQEDFEQNYKASANQSIIPTDTDGSPLNRVKTTKSGWHYQPHGIEITTSVYGSGAVYNKDVNGNDLGFTTSKIFDSNGEELLSTAEQVTAVRTEIEWMPNFDYEIVAGQILQQNAPASDCRMWVIGLPGIADVQFSTGGLNLKHAGNGGKIDTDGRTPKMLYYNNPIPGTNKFKIILKHSAGLQHNFQFIFEIFKA